MKKLVVVIVAASVVPVALACGLDVVGSAPSSGSIPDSSSSSSSSSSGTPSPTNTASATDAPADGPTPPFLALTRTNTAPTINLSTLGTLDWVHWSEKDLVPQRKLTPTPQIGPLINAGGGEVQSDAAGFIFYTWSDGQPTQNLTTMSHVFVTADTARLTLRIAADTTMIRTAHFFVGSTAARSRVSVSLSDNSAPGPVSIETDVLVASADDYRVQYRADSANANLILEITMLERKISTLESSIRVAAATVSQAP